MHNQEKIRRLPITRVGALLTLFLLLLSVGCAATPTPAEPTDDVGSPSAAPEKTLQEDPEQSYRVLQRLRISNQSTVTLRDLVVIFPDERIEFENVPGGTTTEYQEAPLGVYRYAAYEVEVDGQRYQQPVIDWVGEVPMEGDVFTYVIEADPARWQMEGWIIRLVSTRRDEEPAATLSTAGPPGLPPSLLLEMFDGHSVDQGVQQPILSLYRLDADGSLYLLYTPPTLIRWGTSGYGVSPDGQWLVFVETTGLYKMRTDGSEVTRLVDTPDYEVAPVWHPDGQSILYVSHTGDPATAALARIDTAGQPLQAPPISAPSMQNLRIAPDGGALLFTATEPPSHAPTLFMADLASGEKTRLGPEQGQGGIWSPDGQQVVFTGEPTQEQPMLFDRASGKAGVLETTPELAGAFPAGWSPDGRRLVLENRQEDSREIWLWDLDAKTARNLTPNARYPLHFLGWKAAGNRMLVRASLNGPLSQLCELDIATGELFPLSGLPELTMGANLVAWRELLPTPADAEPSARGVQAAPQALPTRIPAGEAEIWVTILGSGDEVANVRSGPATSYGVVGTIGAGKGLQVLAISADHRWLQFRYPHTISGTAWIYAALTDYTPEAGKLPEVEVLPPAP